ncbi:MAG: AMP-binding protein [Silicimonas sp.]|nr:AMP-binding protein [Silicimonas sp.]
MPPAQAQDADTPLQSIWTFNWRGDNRAAAETRFGLSARECFGMTEIGLALYTPSEASHRAGSQSCGVPLPFREAEIRDADGYTLPAGQVGELWVRGDGIAQAYWNKPDANAATFVDGWFATGDLFVQDEAGWFTIVGRKKDMIRRSSENISAREVEAVLQELGGIQEAAVLPVPDDHRGEEAKAYIILVDGMTPENLPPETIAAHCRTRLAPFKIPRFIAYAPELPRTPGRKIAKHKIIAATPDLRAGAYDLTAGAWLDHPARTGTVPS